MPRERTHWEGCWRERTHHECALVRIAALKAELAAERERREAAETLLRRGYTTAELVAHFARYKD